MSKLRPVTVALLALAGMLGGVSAAGPTTEPQGPRTLPEDRRARMRRSRRDSRVPLGNGHATPAEVATVAWKGPGKRTRRERKAARS